MKNILLYLKSLPETGADPSPSGEESSPGHHFGELCDPALAETVYEAAVLTAYNPAVDGSGPSALAVFETRFREVLESAGFFWQSAEKTSMEAVRESSSPSASLPLWRIYSKDRALLNFAREYREFAASGLAVFAKFNPHPGDPQSRLKYAFSTTLRRAVSEPSAARVKEAWRELHAPPAPDVG